MENKMIEREIDLFEAMTFLQKRADKAKAAITKFSALVLENPAHAMEWCDSSFTAAAEISVFRELLGIDLDNPKVSQASIAAYCLDTVLNKSEYVSNRSTSAATNLMSDARLAAWTFAFKLFSGSSLYL